MSVRVAWTLRGEVGSTKFAKPVLAVVAHQVLIVLDQSLQRSARPRPGATE